MELTTKDIIVDKLKSETQFSLDQNYIPLPAFMELMAEREEMPYKSVFGFQAYIDTLSGKMSTACGMTKSALLPIIKQNELMISKGGNLGEDICGSAEFKTLVSLAVPSMIFKDEKNFICPPFVKKFLATTPAFDNLFGDMNWHLDVSSAQINATRNHVNRQSGIHILNKFYNQNFPTNIGEVLKIVHAKTGIEKYHRISNKFDFMEVVNVKPIPELSQETINSLIKSNNPEIWTEYLPTDTFEFHGFVVGNLYDITEVEVISNFKNDVSNKPFEEYSPEKFKDILSKHIKSFLNIEEIQIGNLSPRIKSISESSQCSLTEKDDLNKLTSKTPSDQKGIYDYLVEKKAPVYIEDLNKLEEPSKAEKILIKKGIRSILLSPVLNNEGNIEALMEFGTLKPDVFNSFSTEKMSVVFEILNLGYKKFTDEIVNQTSALIQKNFTSIHPSVQWKFEEVAYDYFSQLQSGVEDIEFKPVLFKDVQPLYGQADIVSSSAIRNASIGEDLVLNLTNLSLLLKTWIAKKEIHLLSAHKCKVDKLIIQLNDHFVSTDESNIVNFLLNDIHPVLKKLSKRHSELDDETYANYLGQLDPELGIIYQKRKDFEQSVMKINHSISDFLEMEEAKMQKILPHFFEKYKTDGVEYNLYLGQSLLPDSKFYNSDIKNFKIWQLEAMCNLTRLVSQLKPSLAIPLSTAQLIFVYNNSLSIRFRMDEKKFDVDGAYNVRYEILKKRIDKSKIEGTDERLTQAGKVAIVYITDEDKIEYLEFLNYLIDKKYIDPNIEDLNLARLQGAEGLRALRVTVLTD